MAPKLAALFVFLPTVWSATIFDVVPKTIGMMRESGVAVSNGYLTTNIPTGGVGSINKYNFDGAVATSFTPVASLTGLKGIVVNSAGTKLYAALSNVVKEYALTDSGATEARTFNTSAIGVSSPAGGCLDADENYLYIPQQGWNFMPSAKDPANKNALLKVKLSDGSITTLFQDVADQSPNGCQVVADKVFMVHMVHGVSYFDLTSNQAAPMQTWSQAVKDAVATSVMPGKAGDGLVIYGGSAYVSMWTLAVAPAITINGTVFKCDYTASVSACEVYATVECADMKLDDKISAKMPRLLCPSRNPMGGALRGIDLPTATATSEPASASVSSGCSIGTSAIYVVLFAVALRWA